MQPCHQKTSEKETMDKQISCITSIINDYDLMVVWFLHEMVEQWTSDNSFLLNYCPMLLQVSKQHITSILKALKLLNQFLQNQGPMLRSAFQLQQLEAIFFNIIVHAAAKSVGDFHIECSNSV